MQLNVELLICKAEMLNEYFSVEIDGLGNLCTLPVVLDQYTPDMDRLPSFVLNLGNNVRTVFKMTLLISVDVRIQVSHLSSRP